MKHLILLALAALALATMTGCHDDDRQSYPPTWKGFALAPAKPVAGDSLTVTALQDHKGHLINATQYTWTLSCTVYKDDLSTEEYTLTETDRTNYDGLNNADPTHRFLLPAGAQGRATIAFRAVYNYSAQGIEVSYGGDYERPAGVMGSILSQSGQMSGGASGTMTFNIN